MGESQSNDDDTERCPNCGEELRMVKNVGRVHWADGAWRLCPSPPIKEPA